MTNYNTTIIYSSYLNQWYHVIPDFRSVYPAWTTVMWLHWINICVINIPKTTKNLERDLESVFYITICRPLFGPAHRKSEFKFPAANSILLIFQNCMFIRNGFYPNILIINLSLKLVFKRKKNTHACLDSQSSLRN